MEYEDKRQKQIDDIIIAALHHYRALIIKELSEIIGDENEIFNTAQMIADITKIKNSISKINPSNKDEFNL